MCKKKPCIPPPLPMCQRAYRASVQAFSKKCGIFRSLRCFLIELAGLIRCCLRYQAMFIVFDSVRRHKNSDYSKKAIKLMRKYAKIHEQMTWEDRVGRDVRLSEVPLPFRTSVQAFSNKCGFFRSLRCFLIELACLIRWCLRYQAMFIVFDSVRRHKNSDYSKKALKLMRKYAKIHEHATSEDRLGRDVPLS